MSDTKCGLPPTSKALSLKSFEQYQEKNCDMCIKDLAGECNTTELNICKKAFNASAEVSASRILELEKQLEQQHKEHVHEFWRDTNCNTKRQTSTPTVTLPDGDKSYTIKNNGKEDVTVGGVRLKHGESKTFPEKSIPEELVHSCENCGNYHGNYHGRYTSCVIHPACIYCLSKTGEDYWTPKEPVCDTPPNDKMFCEWTYKQVPVDKEWHSLMMSVKRDTEDNFSVKNVVILSDDYIDELVPLYKHNEVITQMIKYREVIQEVYQLAKENNKGLCSASSACETIRSKLEVYVQ